MKILGFYLCCIVDQVNTRGMFRIVEAGEGGPALGLPKTSLHKVSFGGYKSP